MAEASKGSGGFRGTGAHRWRLVEQFRAMRLPVTIIASAALLGAAAPAGAALPPPAWTGNGPSGGSVSQLEIDPQHPATMYAGTLGAGVFKSLDGGGHWARASGGLPPDTLVLQMELAPSEPSTVYAQVYSSARLFRTVDGGASWAPVASPPESPSINSIEVDPADARKVFLSTSSGLFRSDDGGGSWSLVGEGVLSRDARHVAIAPTDPRVVYADAGGDVMRSADGGRSWDRRTRISENLDVFVVSPDDPNTLYTFGSDDAVSRSTDGGTTFTELFKAPVLSGSVSDFAVAPGDPSRMYLAVPNGGFTSADRGATWTPLPPLPVGQIRDVEVSPADAGAAFVGSHRGLFRLGGASWRVASRGIAGQEIRGLAVAPSRPRTVYAGTWGDGVARSRDAGATWRRAGLPGTIVYSLAVAPRAPGTVLAAVAGGVARTRDGGAHWSAGKRLPRDDYRAVAIAPSAPRVAYAGTFESGLFRTGDGGRSWRRTKLGATIFSIAVHPRRPRTLWAAGAGLYRSRNGGRTWKTLPIDSGIELDAVVVDPRHPRVLYLGIDGGAVIKSTDGGDSWSAPIARPPLSSVEAIAIDPRHPGTAYAGGYDAEVTGRGGVFRTIDGGATWTDITGGMTTTWTASLALSPDGSRLYAGTTAYGRESGGSVFATQVR